MRFVKYQGTGNDFIVVDNRDGQFKPVREEIIRLCDRHFGIGSDGLILIEHSDTADFYMNFFNPDASRSFCGNGSRCAVHFFRTLVPALPPRIRFEAIDGLHEGQIEREEIQIRMKDVNEVLYLSEEDRYVHTGSPHFIRFTNGLTGREIIHDARLVRYAHEWQPDGVNVNFAEIISDGTLFIRTYERGVENETLSCGTGVTACALAYSAKTGYAGPVRVKTPGGDLSVRFDQQSGAGFTNIWLCGPATAVFNGSIDLIAP
jgi:diaminopimelate epimerase